MDKRVDCMACLVADESGVMSGAVATIGGVTHALAETARGLVFYLCAFDDAGVLKPGMIWTARTYVGDIAYAERGPSANQDSEASPAGQEPDARGPLDSSGP